MNAKFTSRLDEFRRRHNEATDHALVASGAVLLTALQRAHRGGYTSGAYSEGQVRKALTMDPRPVTEDGVRVLRVGLRGTGRPYVKGQKTPAEIAHIATFWELGHFNIFAAKGGAKASDIATKRQGRHMRVEKFRPTGEKSIPKVRETFTREYRAMMKRSAP